MIPIVLAIIAGTAIGVGVSTWQTIARAYGPDPRMPSTMIAWGTLATVLAALAAVLL
ncbi:MAG: hypothetical protein ACRDK2_15615 [Solirubrobacteraceae bacterium]